MEHFTSIQSVIDYFNSIQSIYIYLIVLGLMIIESSFIPFPSEIIIPPAAMIASVHGSNLSIVIVVIAGTAGALIGAYINYYLGAWLGRPIIHKLADTRLAHALLIDRKKIDKAEKYFVNHGKASTFIGRLVPGVRQLISIPAGISKMNIFSFTLYTFLGAGIWNVILAVIGYVCGQNIDKFESIFKELTIALVILAVLFIGYLVYSGLRKRKPEDNSDN
ncbi:MAG: DedA family protein [Prevotellaceae bacterium]|nr:DedA family protein [Prevotellaceae bacterium]